MPDPQASTLVYWRSPIVVDGSGGRLFEELFIPLTKYPRNVAGWARWPANWAALKQARDAMAKQKN